MSAAPESQELQFAKRGSTKSFENLYGTLHESKDRMSVTSFRDLHVWQRAMELVVEVYELTDSFPRTEQFLLTAQIRRSGISIPSNIAEGFCRNSLPSYINHLNIALGSEGELFTQLEIAKRLRFATAAAVDRRVEKLSEVGRMLRGLRTSLEDRLESDR